jgi:hypothetical protein
MYVCDTFVGNNLCHYPVFLYRRSESTSSSLPLKEVRKYIIQSSFTEGQNVHYPVFLYRSSECTLSSFSLQEVRKYIIQSSFITPLMNDEDILM